MPRHSRTGAVFSDLYQSGQSRQRLVVTSIFGLIRRAVGNKERRFSCAVTVAVKAETRKGA
jgi:hypothetical protein